MLDIDATTSKKRDLEENQARKITDYVDFSFVTNLPIASMDNLNLLKINIIMILRTISCVDK